MLDANAHVATDCLLSRIFAAPPLFHQTHSGIDKSGKGGPRLVPPLASMGLTRFAGFVRGDSDGIRTSTPFF